MLIDADYLVGRRFTCRFSHYNGKGTTTVREHDITFVAWDPEKGARWHALDGSRDWLPLATVDAMIESGVLVESEHGAPFVMERA
jgi:hypothetical protein